MSAPETNIEKQQDRHKPALFGMGAVVIWALVLLAGLIGWTVWNGQEPEGAAVQIDGRTGAAEVVADN